MTVHKGGHFTRTRVPLDGQRFEDCTFDDCDIVYAATGPVMLEGSTFNNCRYLFEGPAAETVKFMKALYPIAPSLIEHTFENIRGGPMPGDNAKWITAG